MTLWTAVALALAMAAPGPPADSAPQGPSLYRQVVKVPDVRNGYEDYLRAADAIDQDFFDVLLAWYSGRYEQLVELKRAILAGDTDPPTPWTVERERELEQARELDRLGYLGSRRLMAERFGAAMEMIRAGNRKRVWDPREKVDFSTGFPELLRFKHLPRLIQAMAYVKFSEGDSATATRDLLDGYAFAERMRGTTIIGELVSVACRSTILASFEEHLGQVSSRDAAAMRGQTDALLAEPNPLARTFAAERDVVLASTELLLDDTLLSDSMTNYARSLNPQQRRQVLERLSVSVRERYGRVIACLEGPEASWLAALERGRRPDPSSPVESFASLEEFAEALAEVSIPSFEQVVLASLRARTQLRLLNLHARIIEFRWANNRLPKDLSEVAPEAVWLDPLSGQPFRYQVEDGQYVLSSKGSSATGPIELKYRRLPSLDEGRGVPPPNHH